MQTARLGIAALVAAAASTPACHAGPGGAGAGESVSARAAAPRERLTPDAIDAMIRAAWRKEGIAPAPRADDATFFRRAWLDLAGTVPPPDAVTRFLVDRAP
ncbi:MAG TPA: DUF1549 domain-containing protein, partial [Minicystis sp.]|nr:DUF1549 domain-containing protein [Minicystis sp.]